MRDTTENVAAFILFAKAGDVPEVVPIPMAPIALALGPITNDVTGERGPSGITTFFPRRAVLYCRDEIRPVWPARDVPAVAAP